MPSSGGSKISGKGGGPGLPSGYVSKILYVETKESGPLEGRAPATDPLDPPMSSKS